jgi:tRNA-Thr(GGU) m(6)t(6)A37 methyltransferase TsaA
LSGAGRDVVMRPIGCVRSPFTETSKIPRGLGAEHTAEGLLELVPEMEAGLTDIEGFSHLYVIWVFDRAEDYALLATPPSDDRPHGVFATRSPRRPNPIGLTVVELLGRQGTRLAVRGVDMLDRTPILDLKPYLSSVPAERLRRGWLAEAEARRAAAATGGGQGGEGRGARSRRNTVTALATANTTPRSKSRAAGTTTGRDSRNRPRASSGTPRVHRKKTTA